MSSTAPLVETTEDRLRRELSQSSQAEARESLLREECARLRAQARRVALGLPQVAEAGPMNGQPRALYGPARWPRYVTKDDPNSILLHGAELIAATAG